MTDVEMEKAQAELDRLINDPDVRMDPERVWLLADHLSRVAGQVTTGPATR